MSGIEQYFTRCGKENFITPITKRLPMTKLFFVLYNMISDNQNNDFFPSSAIKLFCCEFFKYWKLFTVFLFRKNIK